MGPTIMVSAVLLVLGAIVVVRRRAKPSTNRNEQNRANPSTTQDFKSFARANAERVQEQARRTGEMPLGTSYDMLLIDYYRTTRVSPFVGDENNSRISELLFDAGMW